MYSHWLSFACLFFLAPFVHAQAPDQDEAIDALIQHSKVHEQIRSIANGFARNVVQMDLPMNRAQKRVLAERGEAAFDSTRLTALVRAYFADHYDAGRALEAVAFIRSREGKQVKALSKNGVAQVDLQEYANSLQDSPPDQNRVDLVIRMGEAQQATAFYMDRVVGVHQAVVRAAEALEGGPVPNQTIEDLAGLRESAHTLVLISFLYMYEDVPQNLFTKYVQFYESEAGQWYVDTYSKAMNYAVEQVAVTLAEELQAE